MAVRRTGSGDNRGVTTLDHWHMGTSADHRYDYWYGRTLFGERGYETPVIPLGDEINYVFNFACRQGFEVIWMAWGWDIVEWAKRHLFKVNKLDIYNEGFEIDTFIEIMGSV